MKERRKELSLEDKNLLSESIAEISKISDTILTINDKYRLTLCGPGIEEYRAMVDHYNILGFGYSDRELELCISIHKKLLQEGNSIAISDKVIDYTDMVYLPSYLDLGSKQKYGFVFVDECQDLSKAQLYIVKKYLRPDSRVLAVGDPYQSIYGFAGADADSFENVKCEFNCQPLDLTDCFRCPKRVIDLAKTIRENINGFKSEPGVVKTIEHRFILANLKPGDLVICRHRTPLHLLTLKLINKDIKVHVHPDEVQEFIGDYKRYFKSLELNKTLTEDNIEKFFDKIRQRNIRQIQCDCKNIDAVIRDIKIDREVRLLEDSLDFLTKKFNDWQINTIGSILLRLKELLAYLGDDAIRISTIHRAKGLENERVFILEYNKLPIKRQLEWENVQERNLHYVAVTRAVQELYLCNEETEPDELDVVDSDLHFIIDDVEDEAPDADNRTIETSHRTIKIAPITKLSTTPKKYYSFSDVAQTPYPGLSRQCQRAKYWAVLEALQDTEYSIDNVVCSIYMDSYVISSPNGVRIYNGYYNAAGTYKFMPKESYEDNLTILMYLNDETNYPISFEYKPLNDGFDAVHSIITAGCKELKILITNIYKEEYSLTYCLKTPRAYAYIKLSFNGKRIITTLAPYSSIGDDDMELNNLLEIISHLWQR